MESRRYFSKHGGLFRVDAVSNSKNYSIAIAADEHSKSDRVEYLGTYIDIKVLSYEEATWKVNSGLKIYIYSLHVDKTMKMAIPTANCAAGPST